MYSATISLPLSATRRPLRNWALAHDTKHRANVPSSFIVKIHAAGRSETSDAKQTATRPRRLYTLLWVPQYIRSVFFISFILYQFISCTTLKPATHTTIYTWLDRIMIILRGSNTQAEYNSAPFVWHKAVGSSQILWTVSKPAGGCIRL